MDSSVRQNAENQLRLARFEKLWSGEVLSWIQSAAELFHWSGRTDFPLSDVAIFDRWHAEAGTHASLLFVNDEPCAYGEVWLDDDDGTAELGRLLVAPQHRRRGWGTALVTRLSAVAHDSGCSKIWLRVFPTNAPALACYRSAGFSRVAPEVEKSLNASERFEFVWMASTTKSTEV